MVKKKESVTTKGVKQDRNKDYIKFRIDAELKEEFKMLAENKGESMSSLMLEFIRESIKQEKKDQDYNLNHKKIIEDRCLKTDKKLIELKEKKFPFDDGLKNNDNILKKVVKVIFNK